MKFSEKKDFKKEQNTKLNITQETKKNTISVKGMLDLLRLLKLV